MPDSTVYKIISLNVRGLKNQRKRRNIFPYLKDQKCHCYFLPETYSEPKDELIWKSEWCGEMLFSHGTNRQKGVCILLNPSACNLSIESQFSDVDGRIVLANISFNSTKVSLCNIYAPVGIGMSLWKLLTKAVVFHGGRPLIAIRCWRYLGNSNLSIF